MSTKINCGQVRGPVQITFAESEEPIRPLEHAITRVAVTNQAKQDAQLEDRGLASSEFGRKEIVPYGLYRAHGFISPHFARDTGFSEADLELLWRALGLMFEHDRSATRGEMATRKLVVFEHESPLGNAPAHQLFERVRVGRNGQDGPAREYSDYRVEIEAEGLPDGITLHERI